MSSQRGSEVTGVARESFDLSLPGVAERPGADSGLPVDDSRSGPFLPSFLRACRQTPPSWEGGLCRPGS